MPLVSMRQLLDHAAENGYGLPAFNVNNLEQVQAVMEAAKEAGAPVILQASAGARKYAGESFIKHLIQAAVEAYPEIPLVMHQDRHEAELAGVPMKLTPTEFAFLRVLARHAGKIVTQRQILREVWGPQGDGQSHYLRVYTNHLRKKLGNQLVIRNEPGIGYRLLEAGT